jgi:hypothetical protein
MPPTGRKVVRHIADNKYSTQVKEFCLDILTWEYWQHFWPSLFCECKSIFRSVLAVVRKAGWWKTILYLSYYVVGIAFAVVPPIILPTTYLSAFSLQSLGGGGVCLPDGQFVLGSDYNIWDVSGIFQINMGFGAFSFSNAKLLDTVWDVVSDLCVVLISGSMLKSFFR